MTTIEENESKLHSSFTQDTGRIDDPINLRQLPVGYLKLLHVISSPIDYQLRKVISVMMESSNIACTEDYVNQLTDLTIAYFDEMAQALRKITELQRRKLPSFSDTQLFLRTRRIEPIEFVQEVIKSKTIGVKSRNELRAIEGSTLKMLKLLDSFNNEFDPEDESLPFYTNERYEIAELVPRQTKRPSYIPTYLPDLPPDYTYQNTAKYMDRLTDLKELRLKLVEESRLTEKSLYDLIEGDGRKWKDNFEKELSQLSEELTEDEEIVQVPPPEAVPEAVADTGEDKKEEIIDGTVKAKDNKSFDFVQYAAKRKQLLETKEEHTEEKLRLRASNIYMTAEKYYSPYPSLKATPEIRLQFKKLMQDEFKSVIKSVRNSEVQKLKRIEEILLERAKKELLLMEGVEKYEFNFNQIKQSDDETDDEEDQPKGDFPVFDFGQLEDVNPDTNVYLSDFDEHPEGVDQDHQVRVPQEVDQVPQVVDHEHQVRVPQEVDQGDEGGVYESDENILKQEFGLEEPSHDDTMLDEELEEHLQDFPNFDQDKSSIGGFGKDKHFPTFDNDAMEVDTQPHAPNDNQGDSDSDDFEDLEVI